MNVESRAELSNQEGVAERPTFPYTILHDYVCILPDKQEERLYGEGEVKLHMPSVSREAPMTGTVMALGPGRMNDEGECLPMPDAVAVGVRVLFAQFAGFDVEEGKTVYRMVQIDDVVAVRREG